MFFSGDSTTRKRVDLGGRSSKERDRKKLVEETKLERNRRHLLRQQNAAALTIQRIYRGRKAVEVARSIERERFLSRFGGSCQNVDRYCFGMGSNFLPQLLFFFNPVRFADVATLVEVCRLLRKYSQNNAGEIVNLFAGTDYVSNTSLVNFRVKKLSIACFQAVYEQRLKFREQLMVLNNFDSPTSVLFETLQVMIDSSLPWLCNTVSYLVQRNLFPMFRNIILALKELNIRGPVGDVSSVEHVLAIVISHVGHTPCICPSIEPQRSFVSQILTVPFLWSLFPNLKEIFSNPRVGRQYFHQMALYAKNHKGIFPKDVSDDLPSFACLVENLLEAAGIAFSHPESSDMAINFAATATYMLEALPPIRLSSKSTQQLNKTYGEEDEMDVDDELPEKVLNSDLELQIYNALSPHFIVQLTNSMLGEYSIANESSSKGTVCRQAEIIGAACAFLHVIFNILPLERSMTVLAYRTGLVSVLWKFIKGCYEKSTWSNVSQLSVYLPADAPGWLLPLAAFCPVYKYMLTLVDNEEFYEQEKPLPLEDIRCLIVILRQALWQLLWVNQVPPPNFSKSSSISAMRNHRVNFLQHIVCVRASELLSQLQDWNNRRQFVTPSHFQADGVNDYFISQATTENTKANEILKLAPFLVPFTSRAQIFTSQLVAMRESEFEPHIGSNAHKLKVRRTQILEDAFNQLNSYTEEDLRGTIRVTFVDEFGVEEAGIDGGGIFKDFMENVTQAAFDTQYGLFKETTDHLLYPNPGSGMVHEMHLQYFHFLGTVLAKAMFEGILVDIPFATFFLSKLKQKHNYLNDLPSLDPELYRHLLFLKHYKGDLSRLELYFTIVNNEYGEQIEDELVTEGKEIRVTSENVIRFIHLVANYRLNFQIREQSTHFLKGFQQLIKKEWIDMFNAHELQLLISGSVDGLDIDDLRANTQYTGGYHPEHYNIEMFWEVIKCLSVENQRKFLKFVTGCSRGPLLGFKRLEPMFCIQRVAGAVSEETLNRLPTAATCMNLLKLPPYRSKEQMELKLLYAINSAAGFDLS